MQGCTLKLDFKNVQRRVYDALNVLCALGVTTKSKNKIQFQGLHHLSLETEDKSEKQAHFIQAQNDIQNIHFELMQRRQYLLELVRQQICVKKLIERNKNVGFTQQPLYPLPLLIIPANACQITD